jgi:glycosyltransferase involved in cell wall biosynthesis
MILMYHKVAPETPTMWWVSVDDFYRQMCELQAFEVVSLEKYDPANPNHRVITFDGVYENVARYALPILKKFKYPFELFVTGNYVGKDNAFDTVEPLTQFASKESLLKMVKGGARLQWHTRSHPDLSKIDDLKTLRKELTVPKALKELDPKGFRWFAFPYGELTQTVVEETKEKFVGALSCIQGNSTDQYQLNRLTVESHTSLAKATIGLIIPSYNYGSYLVEAIESALKQTRPAHKILIVDDGSTDNTFEIARFYAERYPGFIEYHRNEKNLGIVPTFQKAIELIGTEYVCFLGADNRFRSDYIEKTAQILDADEKVAVAYTDFALFGPLASSTFTLMPHDRRGPIIEETYYLVHFPEFTQKAVDNLDEINFMHGSSLYRRDVALSVGGYKKKGKQAEDHNLFLRIVRAGWQAKRVAEPVLEYRQHSRDQANTKLNSYYELMFYKDRYLSLQAELNRIHTSKFWKLLFVYKNPKAALKQYGPKVAGKVLGKIRRKLGV